jgi:hypothetical protein
MNGKHNIRPGTDTHLQFTSTALPVAIGKARSVAPIRNCIAVVNSLLKNVISLSVNKYNIATLFGFPLSIYHSTVALQTRIIWGMCNMLT